MANPKLGKLVRQLENERKRLFPFDSDDGLDSFDGDISNRCSTPITESIAAQNAAEQNAQVDDIMAVTEVDDLDNFELHQDNILTFDQPVDPAAVANSGGNDSSSFLFSYVDQQDYDDFDNTGANKLWESVSTSALCKLSVDDYVNLIIAFSTIYKIPDNAMNALCKFYAAGLPSGHCAPMNFYGVIKAKQSLNDVDICGDIAYLCSGENCCHNLKKSSDICQNPVCRLQGQEQKSSSFVHFRIRPQVEAILRDNILEIYEYLASSIYDDESVGDITTSPAYVELGPNPVGDTLRISLILSADGVQVFNYSKSSFWPCIGIIAELPPKLRASIGNVVTFGFWVGRGARKEPLWHRFISPIITELECLKDGFKMLISGREIQIHIRLFATIFDLPAQSKIWGHKQYNGEPLVDVFRILGAISSEDPLIWMFMFLFVLGDFGCIACMHPGQRIRQLCLYPKIIGMDYKDQKFFEDAWNYLKKPVSAIAKDYFGVKTISPLARIGNPANINLFDPMHMIYRGNGYMILERFFASKGLALHMKD